MRHGRHRFGIGGRLGILALACLVLLATAVPVMADPSEPEPPAPGQPVLQASEYSLPTSAEIGALHEEAVREEEERARELGEQPFVAQRESSLHAYEEETPAEAEELLRSTFGDAFHELNGEPGRALTDGKLDENLGRGAAVVTFDGRNEILQADQRIVAKNDEGEVTKVDLALEHGSEGFEPENPLVETVIGTTAEEGVEIGEEGMTVTQVGAEESKGRLLGDKNVFFGEVEEGSDTDLMVSPTSRGVELFDMLRSVESPDKIRFHLEVPEGDTLKPEAGGGAEIVDGEGKVVDLIDKAHGEDAQGTEVPVEMQVEGDSLVLVTKHREEDLAYPILIDPEIEEYVPQNWGYWWAGQNLQGMGYWKFESVGSGVEGRTSDSAWPGQPGLYTALPIWASSPGWRGTYYLNTKNTGVYLRNMEINPFNRNDELGNPNCPETEEPFDYEGYRDVVQKQWVGNNGLPWENEGKNGWFSHEGWGHQFDIGLQINGNELDIPCWRSLRVGGVSFSMGDWDSPILESATYSGPTGWMKSSATFSVRAEASDGGLGVKAFDFKSPEGVFPTQRRGAIGEAGVECSGTYENPCWNHAWDTYNFTAAGFDPGEQKMQVSALDPTLQASNTENITLKIDPSPPTLRLGGQLEAAIVEGEEEGEGEGQKPGEGGPNLSQPVYDLKLAAEDGSNGSPSAKQSGVKEIKVLIDGKEIKPPLSNASCPESSCTLGGTIPIVMTGLTPGPQHVVAKAYDFAGNPPDVIEENFEYFPHTGLTEEDVTQHFLLPDGQNHGGSSYAGPELAVNAMNGNVVYHQRDVNVEGPDVDLETELFYNSQLPKELSSELGPGWTLKQTPSLGIEGTGGSGGSQTVSGGGAVTSGLQPPEAMAEPEYSPQLNAVVTKQPGGAIEVEEAGGSGATVVYESGDVAEMQVTPTAGVKYEYEGNTQKLTGLAVDDPAATDLPPQPIQKAPVHAPEYRSSFGTAGAASGQLSKPAGVAPDGSGNTWVADSGNNRIEEFGPSGAFVKSIGSVGSGNGQFNTPEALAFASIGNLWVADTGNDRVEEFGPTGTFIRSVGTKGFGSGQFERPTHITVGPEGHVLVSDEGGERIVELGAEGKWITTIAPTGQGGFEPMGVGVAPDGEIWVGDGEHEQLLELRRNGEVTHRVGSYGTGPGQFHHLDAVAVGALGEVWVGDALNDRVQEFTKEGTYVTSFGVAGTEVGQFQFSNEIPMGVSVESDGNLMVTDTGDNRVEHWQVPFIEEKPVFSAAFGSAGTGPGQYQHPGGLAVNDEGDVWVTDVENNRIEELWANGEFKAEIGRAGTGPGEFFRPKSIAFTDEGDFWVADSGNNRLQEFNRNGGFIKSVGVLGSGIGEFNGPEGVAVAPNGHIWVADTNNHRIVELGEEGNTFRVVVDAPELGEFEPTGIAFGPGGNAWIADYGNNRVVEISPAGELLRQIGTTGANDGQFGAPDSVAVDPEGLLYVVDQPNDTIQVFTQTGEYLSQFGGSGTEEGRFSFAHPTGIAADGKGDIWVSDNNRIQRWHTAAWAAPEEEPTHIQDDPMVSVKRTSGQITTIEGPQAGVHRYVHEVGGELLIRDEGPEGTTTFAYDSSKRLSAVTLPNGTKAEITYDTTGRATQVTVTSTSEGTKVTKFKYQQEVGIEEKEGKLVEVPGEDRLTTVEPPVGGGHRTFYVFDNAGDLVRHYNTLTAPTFFTHTGSIIEKAEMQLQSERELTKGDQNVFIEGKSVEGIKTIQIIVNGTTIVDEKTCPYATRVECEKEHISWQTNSRELPPGPMTVEAVLTNFEGLTAALSWAVTVPYIPPSNGGEPEPPTYKQVLNFREAWGLDVHLDPVIDELELQERVQEPIGAWYNPDTPLGQVARASWERWLVPLGPADVEELEYRERYTAHDLPLIEQWGRSRFPETFAGVYMDQRAGGIMRLGFTGGLAESSAHTAELRTQVPLMAPERLGAFAGAPQYSVVYLERLRTEIDQFSLESEELVLSAEIDIGSNDLDVTASNVGEATQALRSRFGALIPIIVTYSPKDSETVKAGKYPYAEEAGPVYGGDYAWTATSGQCSVAFGVWKEVGIAHLNYALTAGHCGDIGDHMYREEFAKKELGQIWISGFKTANVLNGADFSAIQVGLTDTNSPSRINLARNSLLGVKGYAVAPLIAEGKELCHSGAGSFRFNTDAGVSCGPITVEPRLRHNGETGHDEYRGCFKAKIHGGDSGGPVWILGTHIGVGLAVRGKGVEVDEVQPETCFVGMYPSAGVPPDGAVMTNQEMAGVYPQVYEP
jgi:YD repeat-containing protein